MPIFILLVGILLVATGINNTTGNLGALLKKEFTTAPSFVPWLAAILGVGALGFIDNLKPIANSFLVLILVVIILSNGGFVTQLVSALGIANDGTTIFNNPSNPTNGQSVTIGSASSPSGGGLSALTSLFGSNSGSGSSGSSGMDALNSIFGSGAGTDASSLEGLY